MASTQRTRRTQRVQRFLIFVSLVPFVLMQPPKPLAAARPGNIRGRVELRRVATPIERRPGVADLGTPAGRDTPNLLRSVVYLESAPRGAFETNEGGHAVMDQRNETFV